MLKDGEIKFVADDMVGKLAKWLRILGHDVVYFRSIDDEKLITIANSEHRILLTRDTSIAESERVPSCILLESDNYVEQLRQVYRLLALKVQKELTFTRCLICNEKLKDIAKEKVKGRVPPFVFETRDEFVTCENCNKIYWEGTHNKRVEAILDRLLA